MGRRGMYRCPLSDIRSFYRCLIVSFCLFQIEYMLVKFDDKEKKARLCLRAHEVLPTLQESEKQNPE